MAAISVIVMNSGRISSDGKPMFLSVNEEILKKKNIRINSVDWIHDYAPKLELGEYFIVEIEKKNDYQKGMGVCRES